MTPNDLDRAVWLEACRAYARMFNTLNYGALEPWSPDDFQYESQWVYSALESKAAYAAYIVPKMDLIRREGSRLWAEIAYVQAFQPGPGPGPCVVLAQDQRERLHSTLLLKMRGRQIQRADLCFIPAPESCRRTGELPV